MNKKGVIELMFIMIFAMFFFGLASVVSLTSWGYFEDTITSLDNETAPQEVKDEIIGLKSNLLLSDKFFMMFYMMFLILSIVSSASSGDKNGLYLLIFFGFMIIITTLAAVLSNAWTYLLNLEGFVFDIGQIPWTNYFMKYFPIITFLTMMLDLGIIFLKKKVSQPVGGGAIDFE